MPTLPALANLLAIRDEDPRALAALTEHFKPSGEFGARPPLGLREKISAR